MNVVGIVFLSLVLLGAITFLVIQLTRSKPTQKEPVKEGFDPLPSTIIQGMGWGRYVTWIGRANSYLEGYEIQVYSGGVNVSAKTANTPGKTATQSSSYVPQVPSSVL